MNRRSIIATADRTDTARMPVLLGADEVEQLARLLIGVAHWLSDIAEADQVGLLGYCAVAGALAGDAGLDGLVDLVELWAARLARRLP